MVRIALMSLAVLLSLPACSSAQKTFLADCPPVADELEGKRVPVVVDLHTVAGAQPFALGSVLSSEQGAQYKVSKLRYYLSEAALVDSSGAVVRVPLAKADGSPLPYGLALVDADVPSSQAVALMAPPGTYKAVNLSVGVPVTCPTGEPLNHGDASMRAAPLDVDTDMYWSWDPNYIFLKIEGQVQSAGAWKPFFFHVGEDANRGSLHLHVPLTVAAGQPARLDVTVDVNRLFVSPTGEAAPALSGGAHGGAPITQMATNISKSSVFTIR